MNDRSILSIKWMTFVINSIKLFMTLLLNWDARAHERTHARIANAASIGNKIGTTLSKKWLLTRAGVHSVPITYTACYVRNCSVLQTRQKWAALSFAVIEKEDEMRGATVLLWMITRLRDDSCSRFRRLKDAQKREELFSLDLISFRLVLID